MERNWAGNHAYAARALHRPETIEQLQELIAAAPRIRVLGTRHSFSAIADSDELVSLERLPADVDVDHDAGTVRCGGGTTYGGLAGELKHHGLALANLASLPHIGVAGAVATATHGSGDRNGNLATAVAALELVTSDGELRTVRRGEPGFEGHVVSLGALGAVVRIELDVEPAYDVRQEVFEDLAWEALLEHLDEVFAAAYAVSVFSRWGDAADQVWLKQRGDSTRGGLFGARPATEDRHPILGNDPVHATPQLGRPGPWSQRLPHFRLEFTPSNGEELQSEYHVPRRHAAAAIEALRAVGPAIREPLLVCELRTVAPDELWLSPQHDGPTLGIHFTWARDPQRVGEAMRTIESALAPFEPRPHWGKLFHTGRDELAERYPRLPAFRELATRLDPRGAFRNAWLEDRVL